MVYAYGWRFRFQCAFQYSLCRVVLMVALVAMTEGSTDATFSTRSVESF